MKTTVSIGQIDIKLNDPPANLRKVTELTEEAKRRGSDSVIFPELWSVGCDLASISKFATPVHEGVFNQVRGLAKKYSIYIIGSLPSIKDGKVYNSAVIYQPNGKLLGIYDKVHLFPLKDADETTYMAAGNECPLFDTPWGKIAVAICFDLRFPEQFRIYALAGARIIFVPAQWPKARHEHWRLLQRARALENQLYIVTCNRVGASVGHEFFGNSAVINPWGETIIEASREEALLTTEIDLDLIEVAREQHPFLQGRREEVYFK